MNLVGICKFYKDVQGIFIPFIFIIISIIASLRIFAPRKSTYPITSSNYFDDDGCALVDKMSNQDSGKLIHAKKRKARKISKK